MDQKITWDIAQKPIAYPDAVARMEQHQANIFAQKAEELIWLIEHPPLYTGGTSADPAELLHQDFPVYDSGRGGRYTYHGPGQRVGYVMLNLEKRGKDVRRLAPLVCALNAGSLRMALPSILIQTYLILMASCPAASPNILLPVCVI